MRVRSLLRVTLALLVALVAAELFLRGTEISLPPKSVVDRDLGQRLMPGAWINNFAEGFYMGEVNSYGYLGPGYPPERTRPAHRIALIGDSFVQGLELFDQYHFRAVLERTLEANLEEPVEVLNFGVTAIDFRKMYLCYERFARRFEPDLVLFFISEGDMIYRDTRMIGPDLRVEDGQLVVDESFLDGREFRLRESLELGRHSGILALVHRAYQLHKIGATPDILLGKLAPLFLAQQVEPKADAPGSQPGGDDLWEVNRAILNQLEENRGESRPEFLIVCKGPISDSHRELFASHGLAVLDLEDALAELEMEGIDPTFWKATRKRGHWNHDAHRAVGLHLSALLLPRLRSF